MTDKPLTQTAIDKISATGRQFNVADMVGKYAVRGLYLRVEASGRRYWYVRYRYCGGRRMDRIGDASVVPLVHARKIARSILAQAADAEIGRAEDPRKPKADGVTIRDFIDSTYGPFMEPRRKRWDETHRGIVKNFSQILDWSLADPRIPAALQEWQNKAMASRLSPSSVNRYLDGIRGVFTYAVKHDFLDKHPMKKIERLKVDNTRIRYLGSVDPDEPRRFWQALEDREERIRAERDSANQWRAERGYKLFPDLRKARYADHLLPICIIAADSGLRQGEIFQLEWRDVDFYADVLRVRAEIAKSSKARAVPMTQRVRDCLEAWRAQTVPGGLVFKGKEGKPITDIKSAWRNLMKEAEIEGFRFHDLRHDFASRLAMRGVPLFQISRLLGHSDTRTSEKYSHLSPAVERAAIDALEKEIPSRIVAFPTPTPKDGDTKNPT